MVEHNPNPSALAMVPFVSVDDMVALINRTGVAEMIAAIAGYIEEDFARWEKFDKTPRVAAHSRDCLLYTSDAADD